MATIPLERLWELEKCEEQLDAVRGLRRYDLDAFGGKPYPHQDGDYVHYEELQKALGDK